MLIFSPEVNRLVEFFQDVLMIDMSDCVVNVSHDSGDNSPDLGTRGSKDGKVTLQFNEGGSVDSLFKFKGSYLEWCLIYYDIGNTNPISYIQEPSGNYIDMAIAFLERYEMFTEDPIIGEMKNSLESIDEIEPLSKTMGNLKLTIVVRETIPDFTWSYTFENEDYMLLSISFFGPPHIFTLGDRRWRYNMDSSVFPKYKPFTQDSNQELANPSLFSDFLNTEEMDNTKNDNSTGFPINLILMSLLLFVAVPILVLAVKLCKKKNGSHFIEQLSFINPKLLLRAFLECRFWRFSN
jgi:hypothetical protein